MKGTYLLCAVLFLMLGAFSNFTPFILVALVCLAAALVTSDEE